MLYLRRFNNFYRRRKPVHTFKQLALLSTILMTTACATNIHRPEAKADPYENVNRKIFTFNNALYENIVFPIAKGYRAITTPTIRERVSSVTDNVDEPISTVNYLLQLKPKESAISLSRFVINTTLGLGGMFDVATGWGLGQRPTSTNETLASWCVADGPYLLVPFIGPNNPRHLAGTSLDFVADPIYWVTYNDANYRAKISYSYTTVKYVNKAEGFMDIYNDLKENSVDFYATMRSAYMQNQRKYKCRFAPEETTQAYDFDFDEEMED